VGTPASITSADLLGLSTPPAAPAPKPVSNTDMLVEVFGDPYSPPMNNTANNGTSVPEDNIKNGFYYRFVCKNNGVLFENELLQIGVKCEFRQNLGRVTLFYGNKTSMCFSNFSATIVTHGDLATKLNIQLKPAETSIDAGAQIQQFVNSECVDDFSELPLMNIQFTYNNFPQQLSLKLPITINKFFEPTEMNSESFFARWKNLSNPNQEVQKIFKATLPMDTEVTKTKLLGFGVQLLDGVDPNPDNFVCAGIIHTRAMQVGCLLRLEPNRQAQMYRLTIRTSKETVSREISELLGNQF